MVRSTGVWLAALLLIGSTALVRAEELPPNIVFILCDDLGYGDVGCFGQKKTRTPHIDTLARDGMRLTQHYSGAPVCAPSRCVLLTGLHSGHSQVRDNREAQPEGQYPLAEGTVTLPGLLEGYVCGAFGKWGLGGPESSGKPLAQGFDRFFGYNCQRQAHNYYPQHLWSNDEKVLLKNPPFAAHQKFPADADPQNLAAFERYRGPDYAADLISEQALKFIDEHHQKPFFLYYASPVPHLALQVPEDSLKEYAGEFSETPYLGERGYLPHPTPRAAYAAMITRMDREIGRILERLEKYGLQRRTIVVFSSDNGPLYDKLGGTDADFFQSALDLRGRKGSVYEGGIRVPTIVKFPGVVPAGTTSSTLGGFEDWMPTLLSLAGMSTKIPEQADGRDLSPSLRGDWQAPREFLYREFPGYGGQQLVRSGKWKAVRQNLVRPVPTGKKKLAEWKEPLAIELYDLEADPTESTNVAAEHPEVVAKLHAIMLREHQPSAEFKMPRLDDEQAAAHKAAGK